MTTTRPEPLPTLRGYANGLVAAGTWRIQCYDCGVLADGDTENVDPQSLVEIVVSAGFGFHRHERDETQLSHFSMHPGPRRCRACLVRVLTACPDEDCQRRAAETLQSATRRSSSSR